MKILKNQSGSTMLMTLSLMALFGILLASFHISILSMTARVDSTYSEKQTYLYSRSAVTALAEELIALNQQYDEDWTDYRKQLSDYNNGLTATKPSEPTMNNLLSAVDGLTANSPTLTLTDCSFGSTLADSYKLDMDITRVLESDSEGNDVVAYKLRATTTIDGVKEVSDTVSLMLSAEGKEFEITQESIGGDESTPTPDNGVFSGIYTDHELNFDWGSYFLTGIENGAEVVCNEPVDYTLDNSLSGGESRGIIRTNGNMNFSYNSDNVVIENIDFYVNGDFTLTNIHSSIKLINCNIYITGQFNVSTPTYATIKLVDCTIKCTGKNISCGNIDSYKEGNTTINDTAGLELADLNIPLRTKPTWVNDLETLQREHPEQILSFSRDDAPMEAGKTYKLVDAMYHPFTKYEGIDDNDIPAATAESPITIIVPSNMSAALKDSCGPNIYFYIEPKAELTVHTDTFLDDFEAYIYSPEVTSTDSFSVDIWRATNFRGTISVPSLKISTDDCTVGGGYETAPTPPSTSTETIRYNLYTDYIYVRG